MLDVTVAIYARVSTTEQEAQPQLDELRAYCERRGWTPQEYVDAGVSGAKERRPALDRLMREAKRGRIGAVIVWKLDRFGRSLRHLVNALDELRVLNVEFISLTEGMDTSTPNGRLVFAVFAAIAEFERELIRERIRAGMQAAKRKLERGPYRRIRNGREIVVRQIGRPAKKVDLERLHTLRAQGWSASRIAKALGVSKPTVQKFLGGKNGENKASCVGH